MIYTTHYKSPVGDILLASKDNKLIGLWIEGLPCHRVVGTNGSLTGYAGGINKKVYLLKHEQVDMEKLF